MDSKDCALRSLCAQHLWRYKEFLTDGDILELIDLFINLFIYLFVCLLIYLFIYLFIFYAGRLIYNKDSWLFSVTCIV